MKDEHYPPKRAGVKFAVAAGATAVVGLLGGWSARGTLRRSALVGAAVAAGDYALWRVLGNLPEIEAELDERAEEIEVEIGDTVAEE